MEPRAQSARSADRSAASGGLTGSDWLPMELGQYKLLAKLGEGGMGAVYQALHTRLNKPVALKLLPASRMQDAEAVARFQREMRAVGVLDHPHIVRAMDAGEYEGTHYLVMELVSGLDVGEILRRLGPLPVAAACEIVRQAALGLQHAYENGLVHRDIKPSNLMLAAGPHGVQVKVLDLGLARLERSAGGSQLTALDQIVGTIDYMAPEQAGGTHQVDIRADIYALGATLHKLLTRRVPFQGPLYSTTVKKLVALASEDPPPIDTLRPDLPPPLVAVIHRMLARTPEQRYSTPQQLAQALAPWTAGADLAGLLAAARQTQADPPAVAASISEQGTPPLAGSHDTLAVCVAEPADEFVPATTWPDEMAQPPPWYEDKRLLAATAAAAAAMVLLIASAMLLLRAPRGDEAAIEQALAIDAEPGELVHRNVPPLPSWPLEEPQPQDMVPPPATAPVPAEPSPAAPLPAEPLPAEPAPPATPWQPSAEQQAFFKRVATLPADEQAAAVIHKLKEVNPGYDGEYRYHVDGGVVMELIITSDHVRDIWPVRALSKLRQLECRAKERSPLDSLAPLAGLKLHTLHCSQSRVADLSPLAGMPLEVLGIADCLVADLSPLAGLPLTQLWISHCYRVKDLSPLRGMKLKWLFMLRTAVADLSPLAGMPLEVLSLSGCRHITNLSPLRGMPLKYLSLGDCGQLTDLSLLEGMPLESLDVSGMRISDLAIVNGMSLHRIELNNTDISDLTPLKDMQLRTIYCYGAPIGDYSLLKGKPITLLSVTPRLYDDELDAIMRALPLKLVYQHGSQQPTVTVNEYWSTLAEKRSAAEAFVRQTEKLPADRRFNAVQTRLAELNGQGKTRLTYSLIANQIDNVTLTLNPDESWDISPLMALAEVRNLTIHGGHATQDLSCLKFLAVEDLYCPEGMVFTNQGTLRALPMLAFINGTPAAEYIEQARP